MLQEYFFDDYEKIRMVLGDDRKTEERNQFVLKREIDSSLFTSLDASVPEFSYEINRDAFRRMEAYAFLA